MDLDVKALVQRAAEKAHIVLIEQRRMNELAQKDELL